MHILTADSDLKLARNHFIIAHLLIYLIFFLLAMVWFYTLSFCFSLNKLRIYFRSTLEFYLSPSGQCMNSDSPSGSVMRLNTIFYNNDVYLNVIHKNNLEKCLNTYHMYFTKCSSPSKLFQQISFLPWNLYLSAKWYIKIRKLVNLNLIWIKLTWHLKHTCLNFISTMSQGCIFQ